MIAGERSGERALALADATGSAMGKDVIRASDGPGFLVNRCNRPFGLEALRLLQRADRRRRRRSTASAASAAAFAWAPSSSWTSSASTPASTSPELLRAQLRRAPLATLADRRRATVAAGLHGRKSGRGYYDYTGEGPYRPADPEPPAPSAGARIHGSGPLADELRRLATSEDGPEIAVEGLRGTVAGEPFYALVPLSLVEVTGAAGERAFAGLGLHTARVRPQPSASSPASSAR